MSVRVHDVLHGRESEWRDSPSVLYLSIVRNHCRKRSRIMLVHCTFYETILVVVNAVLTKLCDASDKQVKKV